MTKLNRYASILVEIFRRHYQIGIDYFEFEREEIEAVSTVLNINLPKNLGDLIYSFRFRQPMPFEIASTAPEGLEWIIENAGTRTYRFQLSPINRILPTLELAKIKIPDATPEIIASYALTDEQALLAKVRYNRLVDIFLGVVAYSLQNHLRTTVKGVGQIEIDEIYVGLNRHGAQFAIPVQAKAGSDQISVVQTNQDVRCCAEKFPNLLCRPVSAQFLDNNIIAMFELTLDNGQVKVVDEKHYQLLSSYRISSEEIQRYNQN